MVPSMMEELLFDDILYGDRAREEHRRFQQVLGYVADEVLEVQDLLEEVLEVPEQRGAVLDDLGTVLGWDSDMHDRLRDLTAEQLASALITGIEKPAPGIASAASELYWLPPIPNYFFQRDPLVVVGERSVRGSMATSARLREPLLSGYVMSLHPRFASPEGGKFWFQEFSADYSKPSAYARMRPTLEGGDVLVLPGGHAGDRLLRADREDDDRAAGRVAEEAQVAGQAHHRRRDPAGAVLHAPGHRLHDDLAGRVPRVRADDPARRRARRPTSTSATSPSARSRGRPRRTCCRR